MEYEVPILEIKSNEKIVRKALIALASITSIVVISLLTLSLLAMLPIIFALAAAFIYLALIGYGLFALKQLDLQVRIYRDRIVVRKGYIQYDMPFTNIRLIIVEPRVILITFTPSGPGKVAAGLRLPKIISSTYIVRIKLIDGREITFQLLQDEKEAFVRALAKLEKLGIKLPPVEVF